MIKFDSKTRELTLMYRYDIETPDGKKPTSVHGKVDVSGLTEAERQLVIAVSKLVHQFSTGHNVAVRDSSSKDEEAKTSSPIDSLQLALNRYVERKRPSKDTPDEGRRTNVASVTQEKSNLDSDSSIIERLAALSLP